VSALPSEAPRGADRAAIDAVTGAYSRSMLDIRLVEELERARRSGADCAVCVFDVDHFKSVNDAFGHARGDQVLRLAVERIHRMVRGSDLLFRYGGDEFVMVLPDTTPAHALEVAMRVLGGIGSTPFPGEPPLSVSVSMGLACYPADARDPAELIAAADRRSYLAKRRGRACVVADDESTGSGSAPPARLLERDGPLASAQTFLQRVATDGPGSLRVIGERGAGHTRFVEEIAKIAGLRGFEVVVAGGMARPGPAIPAAAAGTGFEAARAGVLVIADGVETWPDAVRLVEERVASEAGPVALAYAGATQALGPDGLTLPLIDTVELLPWTPAGLRVWTRTILRGEPSNALVDWLVSRSGGLPAKAERALSRLTERRALEQTPAGGWTIAADVLAVGDRARRLPAPVTTFVGRGRETAQVADLLRGGRRLLTLVGPGGIGKTRLALEVAAQLYDQFDDGVAFVQLADATSPQLAASAVAQSLGITETPGQPLAETLAEQIAASRLLLVLDNFEQVMGAASLVAELLATAPELKVLVTSRERLRVSGEQVYPVPPLSLPDLDRLPTDPVGAARVLEESSALALFVARAQAVAFDLQIGPAELPSVAALCYRLDGLPLAIELAAARCDEYKPAELLAQLSERLDLLIDGPRDVPIRQQTLRAAIDWSVALLDAQDQVLLARLGVFAGGAVLSAIEAICGAEELGALQPRLAGLVDRSLLAPQPDPGGLVRFTMMETTHAYAMERFVLQADAEAIRARHAAYFAEFAQTSSERLRGEDRRVWLDRTEAEYANLRAAMSWSIEAGEVELAARISTGLYRFWHNGNHIGESQVWLDRVLEAPGEMSDAMRVHVLDNALWFAVDRGELGLASSLANDCLELARRIDDRTIVAETLSALATIAFDAGDYESARIHYQEAVNVRREQQDQSGIAVALASLGAVEYELSNFDSAYLLCSEALVLERVTKHSRGILMCLNSLADIQLAQGNSEAARSFLEESLALSRSDGHTGSEAAALHSLAKASVLDRDFAEAARHAVAALGMFQRLGYRIDIASSLETFALVVGEIDPALAARFFGAADSLRSQFDLVAAPLSNAGREQSLAKLRSILSPDELATAWSSGAAAPIDQVVAEALSFDLRSYGTALDGLRGQDGSSGPLSSAPLLGGASD
jgi:diguanylate cyclase (GGDEF)-like protein